MQKPIPVTNRTPGPVCDITSCKTQTLNRPPLLMQFWSLDGTYGWDTKANPVILVNPDHCCSMVLAILVHGPPVLMHFWSIDPHCCCIFGQWMGPTGEPTISQRRQLETEIFNLLKPRLLQLQGEPSTHRRPYNSVNNTSFLKIHLRVLNLDPPKTLQLNKQHKFPQDTSSSLKTLGNKSYFFSSSAIEHKLVATNRTSSHL